MKKTRREPVDDGWQKKEEKYNKKKKKSTKNKREIRGESSTRFYEILREAGEASSSNSSTIGDIMPEVGAHAI